MREEIAVQLLESIAGSRLTLFLGAGLSLPEPSAVPTAGALAESLAQRHYLDTNEQLKPLDKTNPLGVLAGHFKQRGDLETVFIRLVPWPKFRGQPNPGHAAVADFLCARVIDVGITTNFDTLVELAARDLGETDLVGATDAAGANTPCEYQPYVKIHGCCQASRRATLWCEEQLADNDWRDRLQGLSVWMAGRLIERDILFVGYWSDWAYLNQALCICLGKARPRRVILVDPAPQEELNAKAPVISDWANQDGVQFSHERESGSDFLQDLRRRVSIQFCQQVASIGASRQEAEHVDLDLSALSVDELYDLRRDLSGASRTEPVRDKSPDVNTYGRVGDFLYDLVQAGAIFERAEPSLRGTKVRVLRAFDLISRTWQRMGSTGPLAKDELVACIGAEDDGGAPPHFIRAAQPGSTVRPEWSGEWVDDKRAREILEIA